MEKSIVLIGFMGVGKTTIGKELAQKLQYGFIDIDAEIEKKYQMEAVNIFKVHGEKEFRKTEKELIISNCKLKNKVISVGGGAFLQDEIRQQCMQHSTVVFLDMSWEHWKERISILISSRPVLQGKSLSEIKMLFEERQAIYKTYHVRAQIDHLSIDQAVENITDELEKYNHN